MIRRLWRLATADPAAHVTLAVDPPITRCILCGHNRPDPRNLLDVCQPCVDVFDAHDRGDLRDPHAKTTAKTRPPGPPYPDPSTLRRPA